MKHQITCNVPICPVLDALNLQFLYLTQQNSSLLLCNVIRKMPMQHGWFWLYFKNVAVCQYI